jgi:carbonic anhydrase
LSSTNPSLLTYLSSTQTPHTLWIGCSDSRVPETTITESAPGDIFVHRNIANVVATDDASSSAVLQYGVKHLKVQHVVVCGHTKCGGAAASLSDGDLGEVLNGWLGPVRELRKTHAEELDKLETADEKATRLAELNVQKSVDAVLKHEAVAEAIKTRGLQVHGVIYDVPTATLKSII